jgi:hypothetical protein
VNPTHRLVVDLDELGNVREGVAEFVEQFPEVCARLAFGGVGPELECQS